MRDFKVFLQGTSISGEIIKCCDNIDELKKIKSILDSEIPAMNIRIQRLKSAHVEGYENAVTIEKYLSTKSYRKILGMLSQQAQNRLGELNSIEKAKNTHRITNEMDIKIMFWKNKCMSLAPDMFEEFCSEIIEIIEKLRKTV